MSSKTVARLAHSPVWRFLTRLRIFIFENARLKILSLGLALLLFAFSRQPQRDVMMVDVPLEFINIAPGLEISSDVPAAVNVRLRGAQDVVQGITANQLEVKADLQNKGAGDRVIQLRPVDVLKPGKVEVRRIEPDTIELKLEPTRRKMVPIQVQFIGHVIEGYEQTHAKIEPAQIEIEGPESRLNQVTRILTESVQLDQRRAGFQLAVDLESHNQGVRLVKPEPVKIQVEIAPRKNVE